MLGVLDSPATPALNCTFLFHLLPDGVSLIQMFTFPQFLWNNECTYVYILLAHFIGFVSGRAVLHLPTKCLNIMMNKLDRLVATVE